MTGMGVPEVLAGQRTGIVESLIEIDMTSY